jgi:predicted RNA-binding protein YlxR (DUF448 family)
MIDEQISSNDCVRMCIGCRKREHQSDLLRVVVRESEVIPDDRVRRPGRGAYLHYDRECLAVAVQRRAFSRSFRTDRALSIEVVARVLQPK